MLAGAAEHPATINNKIKTIIKAICIYATIKHLFLNDRSITAYSTSIELMLIVPRLAFTF